MLHIFHFFFSSKCRLFRNAAMFDSCIICILHTDVLQFKRNSGAKGLMSRRLLDINAEQRFMTDRILAVEVQAVVYVTFVCGLRNCGREVTH